eukprot:CAMPEP_0204201772 /NCGR_PEP_ID=MMETSP0361-20130328/67725_1 /ASSEMBLY_ACC=CAM_ASM_000343 /TAXON_ID=268821 /ORGANISM="Scrippsiella Hangoei, Strain SHTV-5" /LENGTH=80 /DNA_ID=CAMNT_0051164461 /DNA_START=37 /DNA_END=276 /DNA_ORIENTATION=-
MAVAAAAPPPAGERWQSRRGAVRWAASFAAIPGAVRLLLSAGGGAPAFATPAAPAGARGVAEAAASELALGRSPASSTEA